MPNLVLALLAGFLVGIVFSAIKLPLPAPPALAGILGIVGSFPRRGHLENHRRESFSRQ